MGKTKTAFVSDFPEQKEKSKQHKKQEEKKQKVHISGLKGGQRIKAIEAEEIPEKKQESEEKKKERKVSVAKTRGKKYKEAKAKVDSSKSYATKNAVELVKDTSYSKFDATVELHLVVKKTGISASVTLPFSTGKEKKIEIASDETIKKLKEGKINFDILLATADMMPKLVPFAKILGPKGMMPNPKNGTLVPNVQKAKSYSASTITIKTEKDAPLIHLGVGKVSQKPQEIEANIEAVINAVGVKQVEKAYTKATMGPAIRLTI